MSIPSLNLVVLRTTSIHSLLSFYSALGLKFVEEKHGDGPIHYACELGATVIEIYLVQENSASECKNGDTTMLGFRVESVDTVLTELREIGIVLLSPPQLSHWGIRAVVQDPDGRKIEITQTAHLVINS